MGANRGETAAAGRKSTAAADTPEAPRLLCSAGQQIGRTFVISGGEMTLGRISANDVCIPIPHVSRRHARIVDQDGVWRLFDLKSRNHTYVNGGVVQEHQLEHGDEIAIADHRFVFLTTAADGERGAPDAMPEILSDPDRGRTVTLRAAIAQDDAPQADSGGVLAEARSEKTLRKQMAVLHQIALTVTADDALQPLLKRIADILIRSFGAERVFILLAEASWGELRPTVASLKQTSEQCGLPLSRTIIEKVVNERASFLCHDATADASFQRAESVVGLNLRSVMCAPLITRERLRGLVYLDNRSVPGEFSEEDLWLLTAIASYVAMMIENCEHTARLRGQMRRLQEQVEEGAPLFVGSSPAVGDVLAMARRAADSNATILILGESGTGKEVLARCIHRWSGRHRAAFVVVNCAALSDELLQSDLFGHERGAFTGAVKQKRGRLEVADGGSLLLDEIGEMPPELQSKLLRFLEEREFERVGGTQSIRVDVRVIAATNKDLAAQVKAGRFREDLYFRLRVVEIAMPPLRRRKGDIPLLADKFLADYALEMGRNLAGFSPEACDLLRAHDWPGNVRELRNAIERAVVLAAGPLITAGDLQLGHPGQSPRAAPASAGFHEQIRALKRQVLQEAIEAAGGVKSLAAERLGLRPSYLSRLMKNLDMR